MKAVLLKRQTVLADARDGSTRTKRSLTLVRVGVESTTLHADVGAQPAWWPATIPWPPSFTPPAGWNAAMKWPPTSLPEMTAGMTITTTPPSSPTPAPATSGLTPGQKNGIAAVGGALLAGLVARFAAGLSAGPVAAVAAGGAVLGHVAYALATGNQVTQVATK